MTGLAGLGFFLFGLWLLEDGIKQLAGRSFKLLLRKHTNHPVKALLVGLLATVVLQSSSVVSLILLALVGAGILGLTNALGIIIGANLGTTVTGWVVAFVGFKVDLESWVMPLIAVGTLLFVFTEGKLSRLASWGRTVLGFGLLLFGLLMLKDAMGGVADRVDLVQYHRYGAVPFAIAGFLFTAVIQSSSATMVITLAALNSGVLELHSAAALVIGADLGTTITVVIGGMGGTAVKKQVALGQFLFNLTTDVIALATLPWLLQAVLAVVGPDEPLFAVVAFHSAFNLLGIVLFLPFLGPFARFLERRTAGPDNLPPGFEDLTDLDPSEPLAATVLLEHAARRFLIETCDLNRYALRISKASRGLPSQLVGERDFLDRYASYKQLQGRLLQSALSMQSERLSPDNAHLIRHLVQSMQGAGQAGKELKDIEHNVRALETEPDSGSQARLQALQARQARIYDQLCELVESVEPGHPETSDSSGALAALTAMLDDNRDAYQASLSDTYKTATTGRRLTPDQLSESLDVTREVYTSTKRLLIAFRHVLLDGEAADRFDASPNR